MFIEDKSPEQWARDLLRQTPDLKAVATFHLKDGDTLVMHDVRVESIGPSGVHPGVVGVEFESGDVEIAHIPFVKYWTIDYI